MDKTFKEAIDNAGDDIPRLLGEAAVNKARATVDKIAQHAHEILQPDQCLFYMRLMVRLMNEKIDAMLLEKLARG